MTAAATSPTSTPPADHVELAGRLRFSVTRLARLLRQQDHGQLSPTMLAALATIAREGPLTLGEVAAAEQVTPPTVTKLVDRLEELGFVTRHVDDGDRRFCRVAITHEGQRQLDAARRRRTAWLATQVRGLTPDEQGRLEAAIDVLEQLTKTAPS